jgi:RHS repeat-associated protein
MKRAWGNWGRLVFCVFVLSQFALFAACSGDSGKREGQGGSASINEGGTAGEAVTSVDGGVAGTAGDTDSAGNTGTKRKNETPTHVCARAELERTTTTSFYDAARCLFEGDSAPQIGVKTGAITAERVAIVRGRVVDAGLKPVAFAVVSVERHPEYGTTKTDRQGYYALAVNGGEVHTLSYVKSGYMKVQRQRRTAWQRFTVYPDIVLLSESAKTTQVDLSIATEPVFAVGSPITDDSGSRTQAVLVRPATAVTLELPDGTSKTLSEFHLRSTEYTAGDAGPNAMPGDLPTTSGYTYAAELSLDEARAVGATRVTFEPPVVSYVDNFLDFPAGTTVPAGYYDQNRNAWVPGDSGIVIKVLANEGGRVALDVTGDDGADDEATLTELGIDSQEIDAIGTRYRAGASLWRVPLSHFSPWDFNWGFGPPADAEVPNPTINSSTSDDCQTEAGGSIIGCESQTLGERLPIAGTPLALHYQSERMPGRRDSSALELSLSGSSLPVSVKSIELEIEVLGKVISRSYAPQPNLVDYFDWDGTDVWGRRWQGRQQVTVRVGYVYDGSYVRTERFANPPTGAAITGSRTRQQVTLWHSWEGFVGSLDAGAIGFGGWTVDVQHLYDPRSKVLYFGDGRKRSADSIGSTISTVVGTGVEGYSGDSGSALEAKISKPHGIVVAPDGTTYLSDDLDHVIRKVSPDGTITTVAGTGTEGFSGDGGPAIAAQFRSPMGLALAPDGTLYIADADNGRVRAMAPDGVVRSVAGGGTIEPTVVTAVPGAKAVMPRPHSLALAADGRLLVADDTSNLLYGISPDGMVSIVAGGGSSTVEGALATDTVIYDPVGIVVAQTGEIYYTEWDAHRVRRIDNTGRVWTVAGTGISGFSGDGGPGVLAKLYHPHTVELGPDGSVYITDEGNLRVRKVSADGYISTIAGTGEPSSASNVGDNGSPLTATFEQPRIVYRHVDGSLWIADYSAGRVRRLRPSLPGYSEGETVLASSDAGELYVFDSRGRHLRTLDAITNVTLLTFEYDASGRLVALVDGNGNETTITRDSKGVPSAIVGPYDAQTELALSSEGYLEHVTDALGRTTKFTYYEGGLLKSLTEPNNGLSGIHRFFYDELGRLTKDESPSGFVQSLERSLIENGTQVTLSTGLGRSRVHRLETTDDGNQRRTVIQPDGSQAVTETTADKTTVVASSGTTLEQTVVGDPRFGLQSPLLTSSVLQIGTLPKTTIERSRTVELRDPSDPTLLAYLTERTAINGRLYEAEFDTENRTSTFTTPMGRKRISAWDSLGRTTFTRVAGLNDVEYRYDTRGRVVAASVGDRVTQYTYGANGALLAVTDPLGLVSTYASDAVGRTLGVTLPDARTLAFDYDAHDNPKLLITPSNGTHRFGYVLGDLLASYTAPAQDAVSLVTGYAYNADEQLTSVTAPDASQTLFTYDEKRGRLLSLTLPGVEGTVSVGYDERTGQVTAQQFAGETIETSYNGELVSSVDYSGAIAGTIAFDYDTNYWVSSVKVSGERAISFERDDDGLLIRAGNEVISRRADNGVVTSTALGDVSDAYSYSPFGELDSYDVTDGTETLFRQNLERDKRGRIIKLTEIVDGESHVYSYGYQVRGWLESVTRDGVALASYAYDANSNRTTATVSGKLTSAVYDASDRLTTYGSNRYDYRSNGSFSSKTDTEGTTRYEYNALGALAKVTLPSGNAITYQLDGAGRRLGKSVNGTLKRGWLYLDELRPIAELDGAGNVVSQFVYATRATSPDYLIRDGKTYRIVSDYRGSVRLVVEVATGDIAQRIDYDAFGRVTANSNPDFQPFGFAGGLYDADTKLVRFGARDYDAEIGRWTNRDPILFSGGQANLYAYVGNDPINYVDPDGKWAFLATMAIGALEGGAIELGLQLATNGWSLDCVKWGHVGAQAALGAGMAGLGQAFSAYRAGTAAAKGEVTVYRAFGGDARAQGFSWTNRDPRTVSNFRDAAGLPSGGPSGATNTADFMITGKANASDIIKSRSAFPLDGNKGGLPELIIDPKNVEITDFAVLNP